jgi:hypothetical protein
VVAVAADVRALNVRHALIATNFRFCIEMTRWSTSGLMQRSRTGRDAHFIARPRNRAVRASHADAGSQDQRTGSIKCSYCVPGHIT